MLNERQRNWLFPASPFPIRTEHFFIRTLLYMALSPCIWYYVFTGFLIKGVVFLYVEQEANGNGAGSCGGVDGVNL